MKCPLCNDTLLPTKHNNGVYVHEYQTTCAFVWGELSEIQIEVLRDAALGRAVRMMPIGAMLWRSEDTWYLHPEHGPCLPMGSGVTLEDALRQAGLMEVEK